MRSRYLPLLCLAVSHAVVDACATVLAPLWSDLKTQFDLSETALFVVLAIPAISPALSQTTAGYLRDRFSGRFLLWAGPLLAAGALCLVGFVQSPAGLILLLLLSGLGVGAYHPEAVVSAGNALPGQRTRGLSLFVYGGSLGLASGPLLGGLAGGEGGLKRLLWIGPPMILLALGAYVLGERHQPPQTTARPPRRLSEMLAGRWKLALALLLLSGLRLVPNMAIDKLLSFSLREQGYTTFQVGAVQSIYLFAASAGTLLLAFRFQPGWEKPFLVVCPLLGIPLLWGLSRDNLPLPALVTLLILYGLILWGTTPTMVSYAHQLFPQGAGLASALTMGAAQGVGGLIQARLTSSHADTPLQAFLACIPCLLIAGIGCAFLPSAREESPLPEKIPVTAAVE